MKKSVTYEEYKEIVQKEIDEEDKLSEEIVDFKIDLNNIHIGYTPGKYLDDTKIKKTLNDFDKQYTEVYNHLNKAIDDYNVKVKKLAQSNQLAKKFFSEDMDKIKELFDAKLFNNVINYCETIVAPLKKGNLDKIEYMIYYTANTSALAAGYQSYLATNSQVDCNYLFNNLTKNKKYCDRTFTNKILNKVFEGYFAQYLDKQVTDFSLLEKYILDANEFVAYYDKNKELLGGIAQKIYKHLQSEFNRLADYYFVTSPNLNNCLSLMKLNKQSRFIYKLRDEFSKDETYLKAQFEKINK